MGLRVRSTLFYQSREGGKEPILGWVGILANEHGIKPSGVNMTEDYW
jgi:hypothetical protein